MASIYRLAKSEADYVATYFLQMLDQRGAVGTAQYFLHTSTPSEGFTHLWERGRLDLTVEAHVLDPRFESLFTPEERRIARQRLEDYGFSFEESRSVVESDRSRPSSRSEPSMNRSCSMVSETSATGRRFPACWGSSVNKISFSSGAHPACRFVSACRVRLSH